MGLKSLNLHVLCLATMQQQIAMESKIIRSIIPPPTPPITGYTKPIVKHADTYSTNSVQLLPTVML